MMLTSSQQRDKTVQAGVCVHHLGRLGVPVAGQQVGELAEMLSNVDGAQADRRASRQGRYREARAGLDRLGAARPTSAGVDGHPVALAPERNGQLLRLYLPGVPVRSGRTW
jgi:hypothetical protein